MRSRIAHGPAVTGVARRLAAVLACAGLLLALATPAVAQSSEGVLRGTVTDSDFDVPIADVRITIVELGLSTRSDENGSYALEGVPPGSYTVIFTADGFERFTRRQVVVTAGRLSDVSVQLEYEVFLIEEFRVTGTDFLADSEVALLELRQDASGLQDAISQELISKAGAGDVAEAITLVVGASLRDGQYATVRGLSDRYTGTTLNGMRIPSADPQRRSVQVDLFPTGTVESITVTKTFRPDLQGDFTGGGVDIVTKSVPDSLTITASASVGYGTLATRIGDFLTYDGSGVDVDAEDESRNLPFDFDRPPDLGFSTAPQFLIPSAQQVEDAQRVNEFSNAFTPVFGTSQGETGLNRGFNLAVGNGFDILEHGRIGVFAGLSHSTSYEYYEGAPGNTLRVNGELPEADGLELNELFNNSDLRTDERGVETVQIGALATVVFQANERNEIGLRVLSNRVTQDSARFQLVEDNEDGTLESQALIYTERNVDSFQISGTHTLDGKMRYGNTQSRGATIEWAFADNFSRQNQPDSRFFFNTLEISETPDGPIFSRDFNVGSSGTESSFTRRQWNVVEEEAFDTKLDVSVPFARKDGDLEGTLKFGVFAEDADRKFRQYSYFYNRPSIVGFVTNPLLIEVRDFAAFVTDDPDALWTDVFLDPERISIPDGFEFCQPPRTTGNSAFFNPCLNPDQQGFTPRRFSEDADYDGQASIFAQYVMAEIPLNRKVEAVAGFRVENTDISTEVFGQNGTVVAVEFTESGQGLLNLSLPQAEGESNISTVNWLPAIGLNYEITPGMNLRFAWSETIARPTFLELTPLSRLEFLGGTQFVGNSDLTISTAENYDIRWEWFRSNGDVFSVSAFYKSLEDPIEYVQLTASSRDVITALNFPEGTVEGFEVEARTTLGKHFDRLRGWSVAANYAYLETAAVLSETALEALETTPDLSSDERPLQGQPAFLFNFNTTYDNPDKGIAAGLFYNLTGDTLLTGAARGQDASTPSQFQVERGVLDLNFKKSWKNGLSVSLRARNLTAEDDASVFRTETGVDGTGYDRSTERRYSVSLGYTY